MNKDQVKGIIDEVAGSAKRKAGDLTDNPKLQVEGMVQQAKGKIQRTWGKAEESVNDATKSAEAHLNTHVTIRSKSSTADAEYKE